MEEGWCQHTMNRALAGEEANKGWFSWLPSCEIDV